ncbi:ATP-binding protein [Mannheimia granulomatis]|uniref:ATP-binding protein n=1 Tax=Mannheimia granulomatis TaxID=85402 RepID=UPI001F51789B|nr:ATP-binding protein [Mannheimia granulomatis]
MLTNCLLNALQTGASEIAIRLLPEENSLAIEIEDNGGGFSEAQLAFPFAPFRSDKPYGLGLGLLLCQRLMQSIGGDIALSNGEDGAKVVLTIPQ